MAYKYLNLCNLVVERRRQSHIFSPKKNPPQLFLYQVTKEAMDMSKGSTDQKLLPSC